MEAHFSRRLTFELSGRRRRGPARRMMNHNGSRGHAGGGPLERRVRHLRFASLLGFDVRSVWAEAAQRNERGDAFGCERQRSDGRATQGSWLSPCLLAESVGSGWLERRSWIDRSEKWRRGLPHRAQLHGVAVLTRSPIRRARSDGSWLAVAPFWRARQRCLRREM